MKKLLLLSFIMLLSASCLAKKSEETTIVPPGNRPPHSFVAESGQKTTPKLTKKTDSKTASQESSNEPANETKIPPLPTNCGSNFDCFETYYRGLVKNFGVGIAFDRLKEHYPYDSYVRSQCHPLTHILGQAAIEIYTDVSEAYNHGNSFCWSGYYHGVMEGVVGKVGRNNFPNMLNDLCAKIPGKNNYTFDYFNCVHGIGHGVMAYSNNELFDSLDMCKKLSGSWEQTSCYGGVFMENVIIDNKNHFTKFLKKDDLLYPCNAVDNLYKGQCYMMQTSYALKINGGSFKATFELCEKADNGYEATCDQSLGRDASSRSYSKVTGIKDICGLGKNFDQQSNCMVGAVKDVISYFHSVEQAKELCSSLEGKLKEVCDSTQESYYKNF